MSVTSSNVQTFDDLKHKIDPHQIKVANPDAEEVEVVAKYPWNGGKYTNGRLVWGEQYGVCSEFLPFAYLDNDPLEMLQDIGEFLNSRPPTKQRVSTSELYQRASPMGMGRGAIHFKSLCLIFGWWRGGEAPASGPYYCNPEYCHSHEGNALDIRSADDPGACAERRFEYLEMVARFNLPLNTLTDAFCVRDRRGVHKWAVDHDIEWGELREEGRRTMARTWKTITNWGYTQREVADAFQRPPTSVSSAIRQFADEFEPPADPSYQVVPAGGEGDE